jgi:hypothetical protein
LFASRDDAIGTDLAGHNIVRLEHLHLAPLTTQDLAVIARDRLGRVSDERTRSYLDARRGDHRAAVPGPLRLTPGRPGPTVRFRQPRRARDEGDNEIEEWLDVDVA